MMTKQEAIRIIAILLTADNGCPVCTKELIERFADKFPDFRDIALQAYKKEFGD